MTAQNIWLAFEEAYHLTGPQRYELVEYEEPGPRRAGLDHVFIGKMRVDNQDVSVSGRGNGLISSALAAFNAASGAQIEVVDYHEHALKHGSDSQAVAYIECRTEDDRRLFGIGIDTDIATASVKAVLSATNAL